MFDDEREQLAHLLHSGTHATHKVPRARILLQAAEGWEDHAICNPVSQNPPFLRQCPSLTKQHVRTSLRGLGC